MKNCKDQKVQKQKTGNGGSKKKYESNVFGRKVKYQSE